MDTTMKKIFSVVATVILLMAGVRCTIDNVDLTRTSYFDPGSQYYHPPAVSVMNDTVVAVNDTFAVNAEVTVINPGPFTCFWYIDGALVDSGGEARLLFSFNETGSRVVSVHVRDSVGVMSEGGDGVMIRVARFEPSVHLTPRDTIIGSNDSVIIHAAVYDTNFTEIEYRWQAENGASFREVADSVIVVKYDGEGEKLITVTVTDDDGFSARDTVIVRVKGEAPIHVGPGDGSVSVKSSVVMRWSPGLFDEYFRVLADTGENPSTVVVDSLRDTVFSLTGLGFCSTYRWKVIGCDAAGRSAESEVREIRMADVSPVPSTPSGPQNGKPHSEYPFTTTVPDSMKNDHMQYQFDYGDGRLSSWKTEGSDTIGWPDYGVYLVRVRTRATADTGVVSAYSGQYEAGILTVDGSSPVTTIIDDCEATDTVLNCWGEVWFGWDDSCNGGNSRITNMEPLPIRGSGSGGDYAMKFTAGEGNPHGTPGQCMKVSYKLGNIVPEINGSPYSNEFGFGTCFESIRTRYKDLTGATAITFWAKASDSITGNFQLQIEKENEIVHFIAPEHVKYGLTWRKYTIDLSTLQPAPWNINETPYSLAEISNINWQIADDGKNPETGTVWIDDIRIEGYVWKP